MLNSFDLAHLIIHAPQAVFFLGLAAATVAAIAARKAERAKNRREVHQRLRRLFEQ